MNFLLQGGVENLTLLKLICYLQKLVKIGLVVSEKFETFSCKLTMYIHIQWCSTCIGQLSDSYEFRLVWYFSYFYTSSSRCNTWLRPILVLPSGVFVMNTSSWWILSFSSILIVLVVPHGRPRVILLPSLEPRLLWFLCKFPKCFWMTIKMVRD